MTATFTILIIVFAVSAAVLIYAYRTSEHKPEDYEDRSVTKNTVSEKNNTVHPMVSVVVPIYNAGSKLDTCIKSVLNQSFKEFELVLVNDGSKDNSLEICLKYAGIDNRIVVINKENGGCIAARRKGVEASKADYLMFVDADDWIDITTIEMLYNESIKCGADVTVCNTYKVVGNTEIVKVAGDRKYFRGDRLYEGCAIRDELVVSYLHGHTFPASLFGKLYKRDLLVSSGKYLSRINFLGEDLYYNLEMMLKANKVKVIDMPLYYYRAGGATSKYMSYLFDDMVSGYQIQKEVIDQYFQDNRSESYKGISIMLLNFFGTCLRNLFDGHLNETEIKLKIRDCAANRDIIECTYNSDCMRYFPQKYLNAIQTNDVDYLFLMGKASHKKSQLRKYAVRLLAKIV